ncbi:MAG TPA: ATP-binding protein [Terriglobales bacterium]|jgi:nitrogen fixation/metabolism regulation signal transduction histidine kinase
MASEPEPAGRPAASPNPTALNPGTIQLLLGLLAGLPAVALALMLMWWPASQGLFSGVNRNEWRILLTVIVVAAWWILVIMARERIETALGTFANMLAAIREGDYTVRARGAGYEDSFGALAAEINDLSTSLRAWRVTGVEAGALLDKVVEAIDIAVFAFDDQQKLKLVNPAGAHLLASAPERLIGRTAEELELAPMLVGEQHRLQEVTFPGGPGRWDIRHTQFRQDGRPHRLLMISDLSQPLREEERLAWYRLIRVLGHEINNSLAPVMSLSESLSALLEPPQPDDWQDDMSRGLGVIRDRSAALNRFMGAYTRLARLPQPDLRETDVRGLIQSAVRLEQRLPVNLRPGPDVHMRLDPDQVEQVLINLLRNAVDAALTTGGNVQIGWDLRHTWLEIWIADEGPGLGTTANLFVPFFTTKPGGSGIGLVLSRQIAEAHHGRLTLSNRRDRTGTEARLYLPLE